MVWHVGCTTVRVRLRTRFGIHLKGNPMKPFRIASMSRATAAFMLVALGAVAGCADNEKNAANGGAGASAPFDPNGGNFEGEDFESDSPNGSGNSRNGGGLEAGGDDASGSAGSGGSAASAPPGADPGQAPDDNGEAARAIEEADVVQVRGGTLYALSRYSGLAVVDISQKDHLKLLGRKRLSGLPFEMYVRDNVAYAMFTAWGEYTYDAAADSYTYNQTSHIAAIDITNPAELKTLGEYDLPGDISDSRIVGDVLYAVSYENGYCYNCTNGNATTVTALGVANPASIGILDRMSFANPQSNGGWGKRSITVTDKRMYVAGEEYNWNGNNQYGSSIQVIDISDPSGKLVKGASVLAHGMIESRWQMDEFDGNLRVISQPGWWGGENPQMQTFKIESSQKLTPLAQVDLKMPQPNERLRSVRFDGKRGYAITAEQKDPLFTLDFSDPAAPLQVGELEMPGFVYHMEPRGDRVFGLGYDNGNQEGSLHVSLFDVSDFAHPKMLARVPFGGTWSNLAEDQDRIHKAFNILPEQGLIMVPYSAYDYTQADKGYYGCSVYSSGIQLIDFTNDTLTKRGVAPQKGDARRAFLSNDRLFAVSDDAVRSFDITDRDAPKQTAQQLLANKVNRTIPAGANKDKLVRLSMDWYTNVVSLEVAASSDPETTTPLGTIEIATQQEAQKGCYSSWGWNSRVFAVGNVVHIIGPSNDNYYYYDGYGGSPDTQGKLRVVSIDINDPSKPTILSDKELDIGEALNQVSWGYGYYYYGGYYGGGYSLVDTGDSSIQIGSTVAFRRQKTSYDSQTGQTTSTESALEVFDLADPKNPLHASTVQLSKGEGATSLLATSNTVLSSHWEKQPSGKVKFYVDRVDLTKPAEPQVLARWNVPGSLAGFDAASKQVVTVDYTNEVYADKQTTTPDGYAYWQNCYDNSYYYGGGVDDAGGQQPEVDYEPIWGNYENHTCIKTHRTFKLSAINNQDKAKLIDQQAFPTSGWLDGIRLGDARLFTVLRSQNQGSRAFTLGIGGSKLEASEIVVEEPNKQGGYYYWGNTYIVDTADTRALLVKYGSNQPKLYTLDTTNLGAPSYKQAGELTSWFNEARIDGDNAICSLAEYGVQVVPLAPKE
jgi:hypothetical protein